jgi:opacity protein-like surface antigen
MKRLLTSAAVLGFTVLAASGASAQDAPSTSPIQFGVMGGATFPTSDFKDVLKTGWNAGVLFNMGWATSPVGLRIDGQWNQFNFKNEPLLDGSHYRVIDGTADAVFNFGSTSMAKFYLLAGAGVYNLKITNPSEDLGDFNRNAVTKFGLNGGAGLKFNLAGISPFIEARYHYVFLSGDDFANNGANPKLQMIPISVGLTF